MDGKILDATDKLDQVYEAIAELIRGNTEGEFVVMHRSSFIESFRYIACSFRKFKKVSMPPPRCVTDSGRANGRADTS